MLLVLAILLQVGPPAACGPAPVNGPGVNGGLTVWADGDLPAFPQRFADETWPRLEAIATELAVDEPAVTVCLYATLGSAEGVEAEAGQLMAVTEEALLVDDGGINKPAPEQLVAEFVREQLASGLVGGDPFLTTGLGYRADLEGQGTLARRLLAAELVDASREITTPSEMIADNGAAAGIWRNLGALATIEAGIDAFGYEEFLDRAQQGLSESDLDAIDAAFEELTERGRVFPIEGIIAIGVAVVVSLVLLFWLLRRARRKSF